MSALPVSHAVNSRYPVEARPNEYISRESWSSSTRRTACMSGLLTLLRPGGRISPLADSSTTCAGGVESTVGPLCCSAQLSAAGHANLVANFLGSRLDGRQPRDTTGALWFGG